MRIAVTGRKGQVVSSLLEKAQARGGFEIVAIGRPELDLARPESVLPALEAVRPDLIVSAAAYTAVDQAGDEPELAFAVNAKGAGAVSAAAARLGAPMIHLSTDYVFDGFKEAPYTEQDAPAPQNVYGASKLAGERAVAAADPQHVILRTAWVYSPFGGNFVRTMLRLAADRETVSVVADQWGNPTSAHDIAEAILHMKEALVDGTAAPGLYHVAGSGATNWADFAREIFAVSRKYGGPYAEVRDIATKDYPTKARRPANSQLATDKLAQVFGWKAPEWRKSMEAVVLRLLDSAARP